VIFARIVSTALLLAPVSAFAAPGQLDVTTADVSQARDSGLRLMSPALRCSDCERSLRFYTQGLGMVEMGRVNLKDVTEIILGFSKDAAHPGIMLIQRKDAGAAPAIELGNGYQRTVLRVDDLQALADRLKAAGYATGPIGGGATYRILMIQDPDGYRYEVVELTAAKATPGG
jgi:catechol 2,3-dioxygenase-like lactoylglutathione lyase family enzyme